MRDPLKSRSSFSPGRRWGIGLDMLLRTLLVIAVMGMLNYLGAIVYHRFYLSSRTEMKLASRTLAVLNSLTNHVEVTLYYDRQDEFLPDIVALLNEYRAVNPRISVRTVDYINDPGEAEKVKAQYRRFFTTQSDKNLIIFDCAGRVKIFPGDALTQYRTVQVAATDPKEKQLQFERHPVFFNGEQAFTAILLALANPQPLKAYFLQGDGEPSLTASSTVGYQKFASVLEQNYISVTNLWIGNAGVPMDCNLLIIAGPRQPLNEIELQQIDKYLREGGRLFMLFNSFSVGHPTGLSTILQSWGVNVLNDVAQDAGHTQTTYDIVVDNFGRHPVVNSLAQVQLQLYMPRPVVKLNETTQPANAPQVDELFATSAGGTLLDNASAPPHSYPLACAIEQKPVAGTAPPRGNTRIVVVGDSIFLGNYYIDSGGNRDFLNSAVNWLCDRPLLSEGIGQRPITNFRLQITQHQRRQLGWLLLVALPGSILLLGWLVWLVRRK